VAFSARLLRLSLALGAAVGVFWLLPREVGMLAMTLLLISWGVLGGLTLHSNWAEKALALSEAAHDLRPLISRLAGAAGLGLIAFAAWMMLPQQPLRMASVALLVLLLAGIALGPLLHQEEIFVSAKPPALPPEPPIHWRWTLLGVSALLILVQIHFLLVAPVHALISHHVQMALFVAWQLGGCAVRRACACQACTSRRRHGRCCSSSCWRCSSACGSWGQACTAGWTR
jgi:hypothetical protein